MMGERRVMQETLFYGFCLERHVPTNHLLRKIDWFVDLSDLRVQLSPFYSDVGRPSIDPGADNPDALVGYCFGIRSERRLCEEVHRRNSFLRPTLWLVTRPPPTPPQSMLIRTIISST